METEEVTIYVSKQRDTPIQLTLSSTQPTCTLLMSNIPNFLSIPEMLTQFGTLIDCITRLHIVATSIPDSYGALLHMLDVERAVQLKSELNLKPISALAKESLFVLFVLNFPPSSSSVAQQQSGSRTATPCGSESVVQGQLTESTHPAGAQPLLTMSPSLSAVNLAPPPPSMMPQHLSPTSFSSFSALENVGEETNNVGGHTMAGGGKKVMWAPASTTAVAEGGKRQRGSGTPSSISAEQPQQVSNMTPSNSGSQLYPPTPFYASHLVEELKGKASTCSICLDLLKEAPLLFTLCGHVFHILCFSRIEDEVCPLCRFNMLEDQGNRSRCCVCNVTSSDLWMCVVCGEVRCGRYNGGHALSHFEVTRHNYAVQVGGFRVWDYVNDSFVHRLITTEDVPKAMSPSSAESQQQNGTTTQSSPLVTTTTTATMSWWEQNDDEFEDDLERAKLESKTEQIAHFYSQIMEHQLHQQHEYYMHQLQEKLKNVQSTSILSEEQEQRRFIVAECVEHYRQLISQSRIFLSKLTQSCRRERNSGGLKEELLLRRTAMASLSESIHRCEVMISNFRPPPPAPKAEGEINEGDQQPSEAKKAANSSEITKRKSVVNIGQQPGGGGKILILKQKVMELETELNKIYSQFDD